MIKGFATREATAIHAEQFRRIQYSPLGRTGLHCSQAGFGCYRVADSVPRHREALCLALENGVNLIDTSANYADGASEVLVGKVLAEVIQSDRLRREEIVVVTKAGYLQGQNYTLSQQRRAKGNPFPDLVAYADGLEHCIHPEFLEDQLTRSLERLSLATIDFFLLHNPEYYLSWAAKQGIDLETARSVYDHRIRQALQYLEQEVVRGRIRQYGISSNTFPEAPDRPDFTCLQRVLDLAGEIGPENHFALIQLPMNLIENGAILTANQPERATLLATARHAGLGILINRPLNAITENGLLRLADIDMPPTRTPEEIVLAIQDLIAAENALCTNILPTFGISDDVKSQVVTQLRIGPALLQQHREFSSYDEWNQAQRSHLLPRVNGVMAFFDQQASPAAFREWAATYRGHLTSVLEAVTSIYAPSAFERAQALKRIVQDAHPDWSGDGTLSQLAIRTLRTTEGISSVLVGMRRPGYVTDVLEELNRPIPARTHEAGWADVKDKLAGLLSVSVHKYDGR